VGEGEAKFAGTDRLAPVSDRANVSMSHRAQRDRGRPLLPEGGSDPVTANLSRNPLQQM